MVLDVPFERTEPTDEEQDDTDADVSEYHAHPDLVRERIHERKHARNVLDRFLQRHMTNYSIFPSFLFFL